MQARRGGELEEEEEEMEWQVSRMSAMMIVLAGG